MEVAVDRSQAAVGAVAISKASEIID